MFLAPWTGLLGTYGYTIESSGAYTMRVARIVRSGTAYAAGVRRGDVLDFQKNAYPIRYSAYYGVNDFRADARFDRSGVDYRTTIAAGAIAREWDAWVWIGFSLVGLVIALLIARRDDTESAALLSLAVSALVCAQLFGDDIWPSPVAGTLFQAISVALYSLVPAFTAAFACSFGTPTRFSVRLRNVTYAFCVLALLSQLTLTINVATLWFDPFAKAASFVAVAIPLAAGACAFACCLATARTLRGAARQRMKLASLAFFFILATLLLDQTNLLGNVNVTATPAFIALNLINALGPFVLWYAIIQRRLVNIGFIVNRALIFAIVSGLVVGSFILLEWALSKWFESAGHATNLVAAIALALALGLSIRFIHVRVDRFVDSMFFRQRHENEAALRRFAHEAPLMTSADALLDRTVSEVLTHSGASSVQVLCLDGGTYRTLRAPVGDSLVIDENDAGILALRAWHEPLALHRYRTAMQGELAFPMLARGELLGVLICGQKENGESYAPDEFDALRTLAHGVGLALASVWGLEGNASTQALLQLILSEIRALPAKLNGGADPSVLAAWPKDGA